MSRDSRPVDTPTLLEVTELEVRYSGVGALWGVDIRVPERSTVAIVGSNGAGKSTLINTISGLVRPAAGRITFDGERIDRAPSEAIVGMGICQVPEGRRIFGNMTVEENLLVGAHTSGDRTAIASRLKDAYALFPRLRERRRQLAGTLSGGEQQMVAIGRALMGDPKLLLLDEPSLGLAPRLVTEVFRTLSDIRARGVTILLVEQNSRLALKHSEYAYVLETGRVALAGTSEELALDPRVERTYLGGSLEPEAREAHRHGHEDDQHAPR